MARVRTAACGVHHPAVRQRNALGPAQRQGATCGDRCWQQQPCLIIAGLRAMGVTAFSMTKDDRLGARTADHRRWTPRSSTRPSRSSAWCRSHAGNGAEEVRDRDRRGAREGQERGRARASRQGPDGARRPDHQLPPRKRPSSRTDPRPGAFDLSMAPAIVVDIGGGSTEVILGGAPALVIGRDATAPKPPGDVPGGAAAGGRNASTRSPRARCV